MTASCTTLLKGPLVTNPHPRYRLLTTGGTASMATAGAGQGVTPRLGAADLLAAVPELGSSAIDLQVEDFRKKPGASLTIDDMAVLATRISELEAAGEAGFVVMQGTDTIEETAFLLDLLHQGEAPVVVTGAMRHSQQSGADGPANLLAAVRTAACGDARGRGCMVVMADEIHAARYVRKCHASSPAAFASPAAGPMGTLIEGTPRFSFTTPRPRCVQLPFARQARVSLVTATLGDDGEDLAERFEHCDGLVVAAFGVGHVPESWVPALEKAARQMPVVFASRTGAGSTATTTYGFPGSERDLLQRGLIAAGPLDPFKARILLLALLRADANPEDIAAAFGQF
ncbi:asparaginase [Streptomyces sp. GC420]|uniref:asparaginase n=1 Tax=Streptomyces sp. GC420 TaxID=2697568 RepID=UPI0028BE7590|nr:asparaginase [Streptomyces sp. GC420]